MKEDKITIKIDRDVGKELHKYKINSDSKTLSDAIKKLLEGVKNDS